MENGIKIQNIVDGVVDLRKNASDISVAVMQECIKHQCLCVGFSLIFFDPDKTCAEKEKWKHGAYILEKGEIDEEHRIRAKRAMDYIAQGVKDIWNETFKKPDKIH